MRAVLFHKYGDASVLRVERVPEPTPKDDEVLVQVLGSSLNNADIGGREGLTRLIHARKLPHIPGYDLSGTVVACGAQVTAFLPGDRVFALVGLSGGAQAERVVVAETKLARVPAGVDLLEAAAVPLAGLTALQGLRTKGQLQAGERVLINGASGGVGSFAVQLAKILGCTVTATCRSSKRDWVASLGADRVLDYQSEDVLARAETWDVVFDAAGSLSFADVAPRLSSHGRMVSVRPEPREALALLKGFAGFSSRYNFLITEANGHTLSLLAHLLAEGRLKSAVSRTFTLEEITEAHRHFESGEAVGKVLIRVA